MEQQPNKVHTSQQNPQHNQPDQPEEQYSDKDFLILILLSALVGTFGIDRFYLGKIGTGVLKLITFGGLGLWWLIDLILIATEKMRDKQGMIVKNK